MRNTPAALVPVGKDCDCGHPLVWRDGSQYCAVYGTHPTGSDRVYFRRQRREYDELIQACMDAPNLARRAVANRERTRRKKAA